MRSFILAHPMNTTKHKKFGFNGNFICVDLITKGKATLSLISNEQFFNIDYYGLHRGKNNKHTYYLKSYSNDIDRNKYFKYISFSIEDILNVARVYIDALYELDTYLFKTKKKDIR